MSGPRDFRNRLLDGIEQRWLVASLVLYAVAGVFWIPVVFMQIEMRNLARSAGGVFRLAAVRRLRAADTP